MTNAKAQALKLAHNGELCGAHELKARFVVDAHATTCSTLRRFKLFHVECFPVVEHEPLCLGLGDVEDVGECDRPVANRVVRISLA